MDKSLKIALGSLGVSLVVLAVKFTAYLNAGSLAPYSDALESIINVATSIAAIKRLARPTQNIPTATTRPNICRRSSSARAIWGNATDAIEAHALRTRHAGKATFVDFDLVVSGI